MVGVAARTEMIGARTFCQGAYTSIAEKLYYCACALSRAGQIESRSEYIRRRSMEGPPLANVSLLSCRTVAHNDVFQFEVFKLAPNGGRNGQGSPFDSSVRVGH